MLEKMGGRKFLTTLFAMVVGGYLEVKGPNGLSMEMATLLIGLVGSFSVSNFLSLRSALASSNGRRKEIAEGTGQVAGEGPSDPEKIEELPQEVPAVDMSQNDAELQQLKQTVGQLSTAVINLNKLVRASLLSKQGD